MNNWEWRRYHRKVNRWFGLGAVLLIAFGILQWPSGFHGFTIAGVEKLFISVFGGALAYLVITLTAWFLLYPLPYFWNWLNGD